MDRNVGTTGLALSGGAILGTAHIGVLQALDEGGVEVTHLAGTSMGAIVATLFAFGNTGKAMQEIAMELHWRDVTRLSPSRLGLLSTEKLQETLRRRLGDVRLEESSRPLALIATDVSTGEKVVMSEGDAVVAASASACVPGIFIPVEREGRLLVDGALVEGLPISPLVEWGVDRIVAVDAYVGMSFRRPANLLELLSNAVNIALANADRREAARADLLISPDLRGFSATDLKDVPKLVEAGYRAAKEALGEHTLEEGGGADFPCPAAVVSPPSPRP